MELVEVDMELVEVDMELVEVDMELVEVDWQTKLRINSALSWFSLRSSLCLLSFCEM